jgi:two-component system response regulator DevR
MAAVERADVFLLAENRLLREALTRILNKKSDIRVVGSCSMAPTAMEQIAMAAPHLLVLDSFNGSSGHSDLIRQVRQLVPGIKLVMVGMEANEQEFLNSVRHGVLGYVLKDATAAEVVDTIRIVMAGQAVCPPSLCAILFNYVARQSNCVPNFHIKLGLGLTSREQQLVLLIGKGFTNKQIASELQLAEQTVRNHVHRMLRKVGASDRLAVVELCRMQGLAV